MQIKTVDVTKNVATDLVDQSVAAMPVMSSTRMEKIAMT